MIEFRRAIQDTTCLNPFDGFKPSQGKVETRWDPLTHLTSRIVHFPAWKIPRFSYDGVIRASLDVKCPFCTENIDGMTSRFNQTKYGFDRLDRNGVTVIPNLLTFDKHCFVAIISKEHFVDIRTLAEAGYLSKGISVLVDVLRIVRNQDKEARHLSINCNYMPMSGSSILHPHIQAIAGAYPTNYQDMMMRESERFFMDKEAVFWEALLDEEERLGARYIGRIGNSRWYMPFAPKGNIDIGCILDKTTVFDLTGDDMSDLNQGLKKALIYLDSENVSSFNMSLFTGCSEDDHFRVNLRIVARRFLPPTNASDTNYFDKIHMESTCLFFPEDVSNRLKLQWEEGGLGRKGDFLV